METYVTLNKIIYRIWETLRANIKDDDDFNERIIENDIVNARALLLRNELNKNKPIDMSIKQRLSNLIVEETTNTHLIGYNRVFLRTKGIIPRLIEKFNKPAITTITLGNDSYNNIPLLDFDTNLFVGNGRFNSNKEFAFLHDEKLYIYNPTRASADPASYIAYYKATYTPLASLAADEINLDIEGVFQDPKAADTTLTNDSKYPVSSWMVDVISSMILEKYLKADINAQQDNTNDSNLKLETTT